MVCDIRCLEVGRESESEGGAGAGDRASNKRKKSANTETQKHECEGWWIPSMSTSMSMSTGTS